MYVRVHIDRIQEKKYYKDMEKRVARCNQLLARIQRGDEKALELLYKEYGALFSHVARYYLMDKSLKDEVLSETFLEIVKTSARSFDSVGNGINWIHTIIKRKAYAKNAEVNKTSFEDIETVYSLALCMSDDTQEKLEIKEALSKLNEDENKVLYMKFWEGLTVREIAKILDKPKSSVQYIIDMAIKKLKNLLASEE